MALRCKLKRKHQKHIIEVIVVIMPEIVSFIKKQRILTEEMLCLRRHGHAKHILAEPLMCKLWLLPGHSEIPVKHGSHLKGRGINATLRRRQAALTIGVRKRNQLGICWSSLTSLHCEWPCAATSD